MPGKENERESWLVRFIAAVKEYIQSAFGVDNVEKRYNKDVKEVKRKAAANPKQNLNDGYESASKWEAGPPGGGQKGSSKGRSKKY